MTDIVAGVGSGCVIGAIAVVTFFVARFAMNRAFGFIVARSIARFERRTGMKWEDVERDADDSRQ